MHWNLSARAQFLSNFNSLIYCTERREVGEASTHVVGWFCFNCTDCKLIVYASKPTQNTDSLTYTPDYITKVFYFSMILIEPNHNHARFGLRLGKHPADCNLESCCYHYIGKQLRIFCLGFFSRSAFLDSSITGK